MREENDSIEMEKLTKITPLVANAALEVGVSRWDLWPRARPG
jgi:hypothetical protein